MNPTEVLENALIAGIGLTHLRVYDQRLGPDGLHSGCAHLHGVTEEAYIGLSGEGCVELHHAETGFRSLPIRKGTYVQFPPDTLHRSVSHDRLEVLAIMGGAGLAERGDARIYFGADVDRRPEEYLRLKALAEQGEAGALERRDASVRAYMGLMDLWHRDRDAYTLELRRFVALHHETLVELRAPLHAIACGAALRQARQAIERIEALPDAATGAAIPVMTCECGEVRLGMCGFLRQI